ncbi:odorant receptor 131-2-like [Anguilla anguilla]|uniref:odorant receptor 131-2-like n=1 Tax=Anguilla anguilla TaxID=7936 RepID=UPI0015AEAF7B|nr:odorant receptor 131-2-like [Anguilla anguilla]
MEEANSSEEFTFIQQEAFHLHLDTGTLTRVVVVITTSIFFIYVNSIMFLTLRSKATFSETSRYILFANMLLIDSVHLVGTTLLYAIGAAGFHLIKTVCALLTLMPATTYTTTPLNLAVMSLERYVAICFPLRHTEITTQRRTNIAIGLVWFFGSLNFIIDMFYITIKQPHSLTAVIPCTRPGLFPAKWHIQLGQGLNSFYFVVVVLTIIYTYIGIIVAARSVSTDKVSARRAHRTVLLHLIQLGLCLTSLLYGIFESMTVTAGSSMYYLQIVNFISLILLPRCLSPLIYGLRDNAFRPLFLRYFRCNFRKIRPDVLGQ